MGYMPNKEADLIKWAENFVEKIVANAAAWQIPAQEGADLQAALNTFKEKYAKAHTPEANSVIVAEKNAAKAHLISLIRTMVNFRLQNPIITDAMRVSVGLPIKDTVRTTIPAPTSRPEFSLKMKDIRCVEVAFFDQETGKKARPYGVGGALIRYDVREQAPADIDALTRSVLATRSPWELTFTEEERGKTVYLSLCWQNLNGKIGTFSEIQSTVIP